MLLCVTCKYRGDAFVDFGRVALKRSRFPVLQILRQPQRPVLDANVYRTTDYRGIFFHSKHTRKIEGIWGTCKKYLKKGLNLRFGGFETGKMGGKRENLHFSGCFEGRKQAEDMKNRWRNEDAGWRNVSPRSMLSAKKERAGQRWACLMPASQNRNWTERAGVRRTICVAWTTFGVKRTPIYAFSWKDK